jgi:hypothetical protein
VWHQLIPVAISATFTILFALIVAAWFMRGVDDPHRRVRWAGAHGLVVTPGNRSLVAWWVPLSGTLRVVGGVSGMVLGTLFDDAFALDTSAGVGFWVWVILGWVAGGTWAWEVVTRATAAPAGSASLVPRRVADYVPAAARWAPAASAAVTVLIAGSGRWLGPVTDPQGFPVGSPVELALLATGAVVLAAAAWVLVRRVVARRQSTTDPDLLAADDAIRSTTTHLISGGSTAAILLLGFQATELVLQPRHLPYGIRFWVPLLLISGAWMSGRYLANRPWQVRRPGIDQRVAAP